MKNSDIVYTKSTVLSMEIALLGNKLKADPIESVVKVYNSKSGAYTKTIQCIVLLSKKKTMSSNQLPKMDTLNA